MKAAPSVPAAPPPVNVALKLKTLLVHLGEASSASLDQNLEKLAGVMQLDLDQHGDLIVDLLMQWYIPLCRCS
jgi:hypothetical protein